jgi:hypothetical protein
MLWGVVAAMVLAVGCNAAMESAPQEDDPEELATQSDVSAMGGDDDDDDDDDGGGECPPPACSVHCGRGGKKVRICHHAPPDRPDSKPIELCIAKPGAKAHLREHKEDYLGCCKKEGEK